MSVTYSSLLETSCSNIASKCFRVVLTHFSNFALDTLRRACWHGGFCEGHTFVRNKRNRSRICCDGLDSDPWSDTFHIRSWQVNQSTLVNNKSSLDRHASRVTAGRRRSMNSHVHKARYPSTSLSGPGTRSQTAYGIWYVTCDYLLERVHNPIPLTFTVSTH